MTAEKSPTEPVEREVPPPVPESSPGETQGTATGPTEMTSLFEEFFNRTSPIHPLDELFDPKHAVEEVDGEPCELPELAEAERHFVKTRCLIITGTEAKNCCWAATTIAMRGDFSFRYAYESVDTGGVTNAELVQQLTRLDREATCFILRRMTPSGARDFAASINRFEASVKELRSTQHAIIVYVPPQTAKRIVETVGWPEHITRLEVPERPLPDSGFAGTKEPKPILQDLFAPSANTPQELLAAQNRLMIPSTLVRLAVLFPNLSTTNFEILLRAVLDGRMIEVAPAKKRVEAKERDALELWTIGRQSYEQQAGLNRVVVGAGRTVRFGSPEIEEKAREWVWRYPEDLLALFSAISKQQILFGDHFDDEEDALFRSYVDATVELACRAPGLFGAKWLEALLQDFAGWVQDQIPAAEKPATDLFDFLAELENQEKRAMFWTRFTKRMAMLAGLLYRDRSGQVVEQFLERLTRRGLGGLVLQIIKRMYDAMPAERRAEWIERMIKDDDATVRRAAVRDLALQLLWFPQTAEPYMAKLCAWLKNVTPGKRPRTYVAGMAFPAFLFDEGEKASVNPDDATSPLLTCLNSPSGSGETVKACCKVALEQEGFGQAAAEFLVREDMIAEDRPSFALASALFKCALALPKAAEGIALELVESAFKPLPMRDQDRVRFWWKNFADQCAERAIGIPGHSEQESRRRESLISHYEVANSLMRC